MSFAAKVRARSRRSLPRAEANGWGKGWPVDRSADMVRVEAGGIVVFVHHRIADLVAMLITETERLGYDLKPGQCWGYAHRPIRGSSEPSNHSWGLAIDENAPSNPMGRPLRTNIPPAVRALWERYGFEWGGTWTSRPDAMHFEFAGTPADADRFTAQARAEFTNQHAPPAAQTPTAPPVPIEEDDDPMVIFQQNAGRGQAVLKDGGQLWPLTAEELAFYEARLRTRKEILNQREWDLMRSNTPNGDRFPWQG